MVPKPPKYRYFGTPKPLKLASLASRQPKIPLSSPKTAAEQPSWCPEARSQGAKTPTKQPSWCQDIKIPPRAKPSGLTGWFSLGWLKPQKSTILVSGYQSSSMSPNPIIYYTLATIPGSPNHQNLTILATRNHRNCHVWPQDGQRSHFPAPRLQLSSQAGAQMPDAKVPRPQLSSQAGAKR